jgi:hypothetical protein
MAVLELDPAVRRADQQRLDQLQQQGLSDQGLTDCCRLVIRYENTPAHALAEQALAILSGWGLERRAAFRQARKLWFSGFRPGAISEELQVGSGADS